MALSQVLRLPPRSMSYRLCHSIGFCTAIAPIPIRAYCAAIHYRFAHSVRDYLYALQRIVLDLTKDSLTQIGLHSDSQEIPIGNLRSPTLLGCLIDALEFKGSLEVVNSIASEDPNTNWLLTFPASPYPSHFKGIQSAVLSVLVRDEQSNDMCRDLAHKASVTLGSVLANTIRIRPCWFANLENIFE